MNTPDPELHLNRPGALIAALPAVLGFVPEKSLVLISMEDGRMGAVMRADLSEQLRDNIERLSQVAANSGADSAVAVMIDSEGAMCPMCADDHRRLCERLNAALADEGVRLSAALVVDRVAAGGHWRCVDGCGSSGTVEDPGASPLAAAAVLEGRRLYRRRADLQAVVAPADSDRAAPLTALIRRRSVDREQQWRTDPDRCTRDDVEAAIAAAGQVSRGIDLPDDELAVLACALTDVSVRDTLYALAVGAEASRAETLWVVLARTLPEPWRVEALVLLAFFAYARGDGPLAGVSLDAALRCDGNHRMATMLDAALQSGMRPDQIRELAVTGYRLAERMGVRLPPRRAFGRRAV